MLENLVTLEVSTAIAAEIVENAFIPWEVYHNIYSISRAALVAAAVDLSLHHRYLQLRRQLELAYNLLLIDPQSSLYNRRQVLEVKQNLPKLASSDTSWENLPTKLPPPLAKVGHSSHSQLNKLLKEPSFLKTLRQLGNTKTLLDRRDRYLTEDHNTIVDTVYAQTTIQLDNTIINRYSQKIFERSDRQQLLQLHEQSVAAAAKQWRGLLKYAAWLNR